MRGVAYALLVSGVLAFSTLGSVSASADCYGDCDDGDYGSSSSSSYQDGPSEFTSTSWCCDDGRSDEGYSYSNYSRRVYRSYDDDDDGGYYRRPYFRGHHWGHRHWGHRHWGYRSHWGHRHWGYRHWGHRHWGFRHHHWGHFDRPYYRGGAWMQTGYDGGWGGCHTAYIPYGWRWFRGTTC